VLSLLIVPLAPANLLVKGQLESVLERVKAKGGVGLTLSSRVVLYCYRDNLDVPEIA
jgi:hypothetical protein